MAGLIPIEDITTLIPASDAKAVADGAADTIEEQTVAAAINTAANAGQHSITWSKPISNTLKSTLEDLGYRVISNVRAADPSCSWTINGF